MVGPVNIAHKNVVECNRIVSHRDFSHVIVVSWIVYMFIPEPLLVDLENVKQVELAKSILINSDHFRRQMSMNIVKKLRLPLLFQINPKRCI